MSESKITYVTVSVTVGILAVQIETVITLTVGMVIVSVTGGRVGGVIVTGAAVGSVRVTVTVELVGVSVGAWTQGAKVEKKWLGCEKRLWWDMYIHLSKLHTKRIEETSNVLTEVWLRLWLWTCWKQPGWRGEWASCWGENDWPRSVWWSVLDLRCERDGSVLLESRRTGMLPLCCFSSLSSEYFTHDKI